MGLGDGDKILVKKFTQYGGEAVVCTTPNTHGSARDRAPPRPLAARPLGGRKAWQVSELRQVSELGIRSREARRLGVKAC